MVVSQFMLLEASAYSVTACELNNPQLAGAHFPSSHWHKNSIHPVLWTEQAAQISNFSSPPEDIYHALSIRMILAQETQPFHRSRWFESSASSCIRWRKSAGNGWKVCLALYSVRTSQVSLEWICLAPELACSLEWMRLCWTLDPICFSLLSL